MRRHFRHWVVILLMLSPSPLMAQEAVSVTFLVNDAEIKDRVLAGATVQILRDGEELLRGSTDEEGRFTALLPLGRYRVSYGLAGYIPVLETEVEVRGDGQLVTTTLSRMLEAALPGAGATVRIVLNWGSEPEQVRDVDSHLFAGHWPPPAHVYYLSKEARLDEQEILLDVDDTDWGGPETVTLSNVEPGSYVYWVHNYSAEAELGLAEVVVRVLFDDAVQAEYRVPPRLSALHWRPFSRLEVGPDLRPRIVDWTTDELAAEAHRQPPTLPPSTEVGGAAGDEDGVGCSPIFIAVMALLFGAAVIRSRHRRRRR